jgi:hypothetical protein
VKGHALKYRIIALATLTLYLLSAGDPAVAAGKFGVGVEGGGNFAWMTAKGADTKIALTGGVFAEYHVLPRLTLRPELLYVRLGGSFDSYSEFYDLVTASSLTLDYLQVPLLAQVNLPSMGRLFPSLYTGPSLMVKVSDNVILETQYGRLDVDIANAKSTYWGWVFGGSLGLFSGPARVFLDVRFTLGLQNFLQAPTLWSDPDTEENLVDPDGNALNLKHNALTVMLGVGL